jgi:hypothetical protein
VSEAHETVFRSMIAAYDRGDRDAMATMFDDAMVGYVTNAEGGVDEVRGATAYLDRVPAGDDASYSVTVTQVVSVSASQVLGMVEIRAERNGRTLHNHAAFLARFGDDRRIDEIWMVDALPASSDEFWS